MVQKTYKRYNREAYYEEAILPIIAELKKACSRENLHMFCTVAVSNNKQGTQYRSSMFDGLCPIEITDNKIPDLVKCMVGFGEAEPDIDPDFKDRKNSKLKRSDGVLVEDSPED